MAKDEVQSFDVLVTGGFGYIGTRLVGTLLERHPNWRISVLDIASPVDLSLTERLHRVFRADVASADAVDAVFADYCPDLVVHSAGVVPSRKKRYSTDSGDWERVKGINYEGTRHVVNAALQAGCKRVVFTSSCTVCVDDLDHDYYFVNESVPLGYATLHYGKTKTMAEQYLLSAELAEKGLIACALRPCTIIGEGDRAVISVFYDLIAKGETNFVVGDGDNLYDFMYIDNAVLAHVLAIENLLTTQTAAGQAFFISNEEPVYFWDFMLYIWAQFGHYPRIRVKIPATLASAVGWFLECWTWWTSTNATLDRGSVKDGIGTRYSDNTKARDILG